MARIPLNRTPKPGYELDALKTVTLTPIGVIESPYQWRDEAPRQATVGAQAEATIVLRRGLQNTLKDLIGFEYCWVLYWFNYSHGWRQQVVPPRDRVKRGLFATRSPDRPNPVGLSAVRIVSIRGVRIVVRGVDMLNGTPVIDIKPYVPAYDSFPGAKAGWVDGLAEPGPDHRWE